MIEEDPPPDRVNEYNGLDCFYWGIHGSYNNGFPVTEKNTLDILLGKKKEFKDDSETPEEYIARMIEEGQVKENESCLYVVHESVSLEFKIKYREANLIRRGGFKVRQHDFVINYNGWKPSVELQKVKDSLKPERYSFRNVKNFPPI